MGPPSFESSNALVVPLAGHELGHWIWRHENIEEKISQILEEKVLNYFRDHWKEFKDIFRGEFDPGDITRNMDIRAVWTVSFDDAMRQCQEIFSDFVGLKLFGASYLHSFEYLVAPFTGEPRSREYPDMRTRAEFLDRAAGFFSIPAPCRYSERFDDSAPISGPADVYLIGTSDAATCEMVDKIVGLVREVSDRLNFPPLSDDESKRCLDRIKNGMPAEGMEYIGDIINAGWSAYRDEVVLPASKLGGRRRIEVLNELLLKSIEVAEFEARMRC